MIRGLLSILLVLAFWICGYSQVGFKLYGEHNDDHIKLAWIPESWPADLTAVIIKRKGNNGSWETLSDKEFIPASFVGKDLSNVDQLPTEQKRLEEKLNELFAAGRAKQVSEKQFKERLNSSPNPGASIAMIFAMDYDLMLLNGFGMIDRNINKSQSYTYGIFPVINGTASVNLVAEITVSPDDMIEIDMVPRSEVIGNNRKLRLVWEFDLTTYRESKIKGFDVYAAQDGEPRQLNDNLIWITSAKEPGLLTLITEFPAERTVFTAVPVSYFNKSGSEHSLIFNPIYYTTKVPAPVLDGTASDDTIELKWVMDHQYDSLFKKIVVAQWQDQEFVLIGELNPMDRSFRDTSIGEGSSRYRISALTKSGKVINSNDKIITNNPKVVVAAPTNLTSEVIMDSTGNFIYLRWSYPEEDNDKTFRIFSSGPNGNLIYNAALNKNVSSPMKIPVRTFAGTKETYAIQAMDEKRNKSDLSNTVEIITPSKRLPQPTIGSVEAVSGKRILNWSYSDSHMDLKGFKILINGEEVLDDNEVTGLAREAELPISDQGVNVVTIKAISIYGLESVESSSYKFRVE